MTNPQNIDELIARLEAATGSSRALDTEIAMALGRAYETSVIDAGDTKVRVPWYPDMFRPGRVKFAPCYTDSVDAALTLIPKDYAWSVQYSESCGGSAWLYPPNNDEDIEFKGDAATPALAVCIAALKAKQS